MSKIHPNTKIRDRNLSPSRVITLLCKQSMTLILAIAISRPILPYSYVIDEEYEVMEHMHLFYTIAILMEKSKFIFLKYKNFKL